MGIIISLKKIRTQINHLNSDENSINENQTFPLLLALFLNPELIP